MEGACNVRKKVIVGFPRKVAKNGEKSVKNPIFFMKSVKEVEIGKNYSALFCREFNFRGCVHSQNLKFLKTLDARALGKFTEIKNLPCFAYWSRPTPIFGQCIFFKRCPYFLATKRRFPISKILIPRFLMIFRKLKIPDFTPFLG